MPIAAASTAAPCEVALRFTRKTVVLSVDSGSTLLLRLPTSPRRSIGALVRETN
jgi:hypothetical protein